MKASPLALLVPLVAAGCLELPTFERPDAPARDAPLASATLTVVGVRVESFDGRVWAPAGIPRRPHITVSFSRIPDADAPVYVLTGALDDGLRDDLESSPLRAATLERAVDVERLESLAAVTLTPRVPLTAGAELVVVVGAWARSGSARLAAATALPLVVSDDPALGAVAIEAWPPDGASSVAPTVPFLAVRFDGEVVIDDRSLVLAGPHGDVAGAVRVASCAQIGWPAPACATLDPDAALTPSTTYALRLDTIVDATGAPLPPFTATLATADEAGGPPALSPVVCGLDESEVETGCALSDDRSVALRLRSTEPLRVALDGADGRVRTVLARGEGTIGLGGLVPDRALPLVLRVSGTSGETLEVPLALATTEPLAELAIAEVRADPFGREPAQEYVELANLGPSRIELEGMHLTDALDDEGDVLPAVSIPAGGRVLVVADAFDPDDAADVPVPPGVALARIDASIGTGGLSSYGEQLFLRDAEGRRISSSPAVTSGAGQCLVRTASDARRGDGAAFVVGPCTPGRAP